ncbi:MAG: hypothetical protein ABI779_14580 [Acidobacteriota bacterium]
MTLKAAYFQLRADYFGRPMDDGILRALLGAGYVVDVFAPDGDLPQTEYGDGVRRRSVEYRRSWLQRHLRRGKWRAYDLFLGTADLPMAFAGMLAYVAGRPSVSVCDEIYLGGYEGQATLYWKSLTRWAMRRARFTIITDVVRNPLQREYAGLPAGHEFIPFPSSYATPYDGRSREEARSALGIADDEFVVSSTGSCRSENGTEWLVRLAGRDGIRIMIQTAGRPDPVTDALLRRLEGALYLPERLGFRESTATTIAADVSAVFYLSPKPQFQHMGVSSQKLGTALWLGMPVVATRQESFRFIEDYRCGELIDREEDLPAALQRIRANRLEYAANALRATAESIRPAEKLEHLTDRLKRL